MTEKITILRTKQVCEKLCVGTTTLFTTYIKQNPTFPKPTKIGGTNAWKESDIDDWINQQIENQQSQNEVTA